MSHEELKQKEEYDKMMAIANAHKKRVRDQLAELTAEYNKLIKAYVIFFADFAIQRIAQNVTFSQSTYCISILEIAHCQYRSKST